MTKSEANQYHGQTCVIKLGGSILNNETTIQSLCADIKLLHDAAIKIIIVHGGSHAIKHYLSALNIHSEFLDGLRVTSAEAMKVIEMVLIGHVNTSLVRQLNFVGINAIGLSGADNKILQCQYYSKQHGHVGCVKHVNPQAIIATLSQHCISVIAPVGIHENGAALNINADYAATQIATAIKANHLIFLTDQDGVYDATGNIYPELSTIAMQNLIDNQTVTGGMLVKIKAIRQALSTYLNQVHIVNGTEPHALIKKLFTCQSIGTSCFSN